MDKKVKIHFTAGGNTSHILVDGMKFRYVSTYGSAGAAADAARNEYPDNEFVIYPLGGWGNPRTPALFVRN
jgi:hypothetical protein